MILKDQFRQIIENSLELLNSQVIVPYIKNCFQSISNFVEKKTHTSIRFTYDNTNMILQGFYKIGVENCKKEYENYNSILKFKAQYILDYQIMKQTRQKWFNTEFMDSLSYKNHNISLDFYKFIKRESISEVDMEFYVKKYKLYNSFKITLS